MGHTVTAHVIRSAPDLALLEALPERIAWAVYRENDAPAWYIDTFTPGRKHDRPFTSMPILKGIPLALPETLGQLRRVFAALDKAELLYGGELDLLNLNLLLSRALHVPVLSIYSDDEGVDIACVSNDGTLQRLRCECLDIEVIFADGRIHVQPLRFEDDDLEPTDLTHLHDPDGGISVMERNKDQVLRLHFVASEEVSSFLGVAKPPLGLGSFEGMTTPLTKVAALADSTASAQSETETRPWWKFW